MPKQPNILILLADQLRYDALGCNGAPVCRTPAMDSVAAAGVQFSSAFTPIALCTPARASLLTGRYPHNHLQLSNMGNFNGVFDDRHRPAHAAVPARRRRLPDRLCRQVAPAARGRRRTVGRAPLAYARRVVRPAEAGRLRLRPRRGAAPGVGQGGAVRRAQQPARRAHPGGVDGGPCHRNGRCLRRR